MFGGIATTHAALLYVTPSTTTISKDATFTVTVRTDTEGQSINVAEATVSFPSDKLKIVKATPGSTFSIQSPGAPRISKNQVFFSAGIPTPGYTGKSGVVGTITFKAIAPGAAMIRVDSGKILLNDGKATDALVQRASATITVKDMPLPQQPETPVIEPIQQVEEMPIEQPEEVIIPTPSETTQVSVQEVPKSDVVTTITIRVKDLIRVIYILAILLGIFIVISLYLFVSNINLKHKYKQVRELGSTS